MSDANRQLTGILDHQAVEIDRIGNRAESVAGTVANVLPEICTTVTQVEDTGHAVLGTAEDLIGRSQWLVDAVSRYFSDLEHGSIKIGILHSLSGTMTASERPLQELLVMLIEQQNARGGLLGRPIEPVIMNPRSDPKPMPSRRAADRRAQGRGDLRLLDLGLAQGGAADRRARQRAAVLSEPVRGPGSIAATSSIPAPRRISRRFRQSTSCATQGIAGSSWSAPTTSIRAPPTPCSRATWRRKASPATWSPSATSRSDCTDWRAVVEDIRRFAKAQGHAPRSSPPSPGDANLHFFRELARQGVTADDDSGHVAVDQRGRIAGADALEHGRAISWPGTTCMRSTAGRTAPSSPTGAASPASPRRSPTTRWKRPGSASTSGARRSKRPAPPRSTRCAPRSAAGRSPRRAASRVKMDGKTHHLYKPVMIGRIAKDGRILPVSVTEGLVPPEPWSPWLRRPRRRTPRRQPRRRAVAGSLPKSADRVDAAATGSARIPPRQGP